MRLSPLEPWFRQSPPMSLDEGAVLRLEDLSLRRRFGCKGPGAQAWLAAAGYGVPPEPNSAAIDADGVLVARLTTAEFLVEATGAAVEATPAGAAARVESSLRELTSSAYPSNVYPVARQDLVMGIEGAALNDLLRQTCSFDFAPLLERCDRDAGPIILTSMIGVGVTAFLRRTAQDPYMTLWVDPSFAHYFWTTLLEVGGDLGRINIKARSNT